MAGKKERARIERLAKLNAAHQAMVQRVMVRDAMKWALMERDIRKRVAESYGLKRGALGYMIRPAAVDGVTVGPRFLGRKVKV